MLKKKSLGQHFLRNSRILQRIADAVLLAPEDTVLEVGPGEGTLTAFLLERAGKVIAVEKDDRLIPLLHQRFQKEIAAGKLELIHEDILEFETKRSTLNATRYKVVANLPYYITGQFLRKFLQADHQPSSMTLLLQREVAKRIVATGTKESLLSVSVKCYGEPRYIDTVKAGVFSPPPKVDSAILAIENISKKFFGGLEHVPKPFPACESRVLVTKRSPRTHCSLATVRSPARFLTDEPATLGLGTRVSEHALSEEQFFSLLKKGFAHPRKLLASNLGVPPSILHQCGIAQNARAENVSPVQWKSLALYQYGCGGVPNYL